MATTEIPIRSDHSQPDVAPHVGVVTEHRQRRRSIRSLVRPALATILTAIVVLAGGFAVRDVASGAWEITPVLSGSMRPGFSIGGAVISQRVPVSDLAVRDVIIFRDPLDDSMRVVHRVISVTHRNGALLVRTRGDDNTAPDPWTLKLTDPTVYRVRMSVPFLGYVSVFVDNHRGLLLLLVGSALVLASVTTVRRFPSQRDRRGQRVAASAASRASEVSEPG